MAKPDVPWWTTCDDLFSNGRLSDGYKNFIRDEYEANKIECFQNSIVPGLLQTEAYARAVSGLQWPAVATQKEINAWVTVRLKRQWEVFERTSRPTLHFIIDESALYRQIGGPGVLYEQLIHLLKLHEMKDVILQILPLHEGSELYPYPLTCFIIFSFADKQRTPTLYCEYPLYFSKHIEDASSLFLYERTFMRLQTIADNPEWSKARIQKAIKVLDEAGEQRKTK